MTVQNKIVGYEPAVDPEELVAYPGNHRVHPQKQRAALVAGMKEEELGGWIDAVKVNVTTGHVVDGHLRVDEAMKQGTTVPVLYLDLSPEQEAKAVAVFDAIGELAVVDQDVLTVALEDIEFSSPELIELTTDLLPDPPGGDNPEETADQAELSWKSASTAHKNRKIQTTQAEIELLDAAYEAHTSLEGSSVGFVASLVAALDASKEPNL